MATRINAIGELTSRVILGERISNKDAHHQLLPIPIGLATLASDVISSVGYAPMEMFIILAMAGRSYLSLGIPIMVLILIMLFVLTVSYRQTIFAYPGGGGSMIVAKDNLTSTRFGELPAMVAGASLNIDYILTVAVSLSSGADQVASTFPLLLPYKVHMALGALLLMAIMNLRGVKESGKTFMIPTYFFVVMIYLTMIVGAIQYMTGSLGTVQGVQFIQHTVHNVESFGIVWFFAYAFATAGTTVTGTEAVSNGVYLFKEPKSKNAATTMTLMSSLNGSMAMGLVLIALAIKIVPSVEVTLLAQIGQVVYGSGPFGIVLFGLLMASATAILFMAANTAFADQPRLMALQGKFGYLPRMFTQIGRRMVYQVGIIFLTGSAALLIFALQAQTGKLIPLYALGVFLGFTLSQYGMARHWWRAGKMLPGEKEENDNGSIEFVPDWKSKLLINFLGGTMTLVVLIVIAITKGPEGAWIVMLLIPSLVILQWLFHKHYRGVACKLKINGTPIHWEGATRKRRIVLVEDVHMLTVEMIKHALSSETEWVAVHFNSDDHRCERVIQRWDQYVKPKANHELVILPDEMRLLGPAIRRYIESQQDPQLHIEIMIGRLESDSPFDFLLHNGTHEVIESAVAGLQNVVIMEFPYQV